jgi:REP element-mobilizing transposase RayT
MLRKARIDASGALHHTIARGIDRNRIFQDDYDQKNFIERLPAILNETKTVCYAWALIPNYFHLLLRTELYQKSDCDFINTVRSEFVC